MAAPLPAEVDLVVVGSGAGGMLAAIRAKDAGLSVLVVEKAAQLGGTSALSGGDIWIPCNHDQAKAGVEDNLADAFRYVRSAARGMSSNERILAYLETAPQMADYLGRIGVGYRCVPLYADYYPTLPGARPGGRTMDPLGFNAAKLGLDALEHVRPTNPGQLIMGRMNINSFDAHTMLSKGRGSNWVLVKIMLRYALDYPWRWKTKRDRRLTGGQALVTGLYWALRQRGIPLALDTPMRELVYADGRVTGVVVERAGTRHTVTARRGVLLAAGGFERNQAMREQYLPQPTDAHWTATPPAGNTGDAIRAAQALGAATALMAHTWGAPTIQVPKEEKYRPLFVERSMPGCMVVNAQGKRFLDESGPYPEFQQAMFADHAANGGAIPAWIVFDADFRRKYPMGPLMPSVAQPDHRVRKSWWNTLVWKGETLEELAATIGVDAAGLKDSATRMTRFAASGVDEDFGRGGNVFDRYYGDVNVKPNPNLAPIAKGPFYAMKIWPGDIGTKGGLVTDLDARVLDATGAAIPGLYCIGNNSASVMGPSYPGAGSTLGPAMTFAYRAVAHAAGTPLALEHRDLLAAAESAGSQP